MLRQRSVGNPLDAIEPVVTTAQVRSLVAWARAVYVSPAVEDYAVALAQATRSHAELRLGASPRATLQLVRAAKVNAALDGRTYVLPDDLVSLLEPVLAHRLIPARTTAHSRRTADSVPAILARVAASVPVPVAR